MTDQPTPLTTAALERSPDLCDALRALNNAHAAALSWLEPGKLERLVEAAFVARRIGEAQALLLAFDRDADYDSPNFLWFRARYSDFIYVDRVVVAAEARGRGHARTLYLDLFQAARRAGARRIVCEVNSIPPNPVSDAFHAAFGFVEVGQARLDDGRKTVRYLERVL